MAVGTIVPGTARVDGVYAYVSVVVNEGGAVGPVEYPGQTPLAKDDGTAKTGAEIKADLVASVKAARDAQIKAAAQALGGVSGNVAL